MTWKQNDAPIKLIHILPSSGKSPSSDSIESSPRSYRLGIEGSGGSAFSLLRLLRNVITKSSSSPAGSTDNLEQNTTTESLYAPQFSGMSRIRSWLEHVGKVCKGIMTTLFRRFKSSEIDSYAYSTDPPDGTVSLDALAEDGSEPLDLCEVQPEPVNHLSNQGESLSIEVGVLRDQMRSQQEDVTRITSQLTDLKNLVLSQQQVLLHLGKELEGIHLAVTVPPPKAPRKTKARAGKTSKPKSALPKKQTADQPPSLEAHP